MRYLVLSLFFALQSKALTVMLIDSGVNLKALPNVTGDGPFIGTMSEGHRSHGTHVASVIIREAHCPTLQVVSCSQRIKDYADCLREAVALHPDVLNLSIVGYSPIREEREYIDKLVHSGTKIFAATGNDSLNLDTGLKTAFPAQLPGVTAVTSSTGHYANKLSNAIEEDGTNVIGLDYMGQTITMSGTSQATAIASGKYLKKLCSP